LSSDVTVRTDGDSDRKMPRADDVILVLNYGSQYSRLIARRLRELGVYSELVAPTFEAERAFRELSPKGVILSGGPFSAQEAAAPQVPAFLKSAQVPVLGICYGMQLWAHSFDGEISSGAEREYGKAEVEWIASQSPLTKGLPRSSSVWMSHGDSVKRAPPGFDVLGRTERGAVAAIGRGNVFGLQFHPEVSHSEHGMDILRNFVFGICGCDRSWVPEDFVRRAIAGIRSQVGTGRVVCALSGGVDSAVTATLVQRAIGDRLTCICVDNGLLRHGELDTVQELFGNRLEMDVRIVDAVDECLSGLAGLADPEDKRKTIGRLFIEIFEKQIQSLGRVDFLAQGTLYPDVIESAGDSSGSAALIKSHHNVGGLPSHMRLTLIEPLRFLFKDEVRAVGRQLGLPDEIVSRQPFPGPGLAVRVVGSIDKEKLERVRAADRIVREETERTIWRKRLWQYFCVLVPSLHRVGVMGDHRTYGETVIVRAVHSEDGMTAEWAKMPMALLERISSRIVNEVEDVTTVLYDITNKPPATIEWE